MKLVFSRTSDSLVQSRALQDGRSLGPMTWVLAILMLITTLAAAVALIMGSAASDLSSALNNRFTVQIVEANPDIRHAQVSAAVSLLRKQSGVASVDPVDEGALNALVAPWLGSDGEAAGLPYPALIDVTLSDGTDAQALIASLRNTIVSVAPSARIQADASWLGPLNSMISTMFWLSLVLMGLMLVAMGAAVILSARAALGAHRPTIDLLHLMGSSDTQISRLFQRRIAVDALIAGMIGLVGAALILLLVQSQAGQMNSEFLDSAHLAWWGWLVLLSLPFLNAGLAVTTAHYSIIRALRHI